MLRLAEGLATVTAQQRALLHDLVAGARALHAAAAWMGRLEEGQGENEASLLVLPPQVRACVKACVR